MRILFFLYHVNATELIILYSLSYPKSATNTRALDCQMMIKNISHTTQKALVECCGVVVRLYYLFTRGISICDREPTTYCFVWVATHHPRCVCVVVSCACAHIAEHAANCTTRSTYYTYCAINTRLSRARSPQYQYVDSRRTSDKYCMRRCFA